MDASEIYLHICDGVGSISLPETPIPSISGPLIPSNKKICVQIAISPISSLGLEGCVYECLSCPSKSSRLLIFDYKMTFALPEACIAEPTGYCLIISLVLFPLDATNNSGKIVLASTNMAFDEFLKQFRSLVKPRRIDQIFDLKAIDPKNISKASIRIRVGILVISSSYDKSIVDKTIEEFGKVSVKAALTRKEAIEDTPLGLKYNNSTVNTLDLSNSVTIKQNQSLLVKTLHGIFDNIRKASNTTSQVHVPSSVIVALVRVISEQAADYIDKIIESIISISLNVTSESGDLSGSQVQDVIHSLGINNTSSRKSNASISASRFGARSLSSTSINIDTHNTNSLDSSVLLLNKMMIKRLLIGNSPIIKISFFEDSIKSYIFNLLGKRYEAIAAPTNDWQVKIAVMERLLSGMMDNFEHLGIVGSSRAEEPSVSLECKSDTNTSSSLLTKFSEIQTQISPDDARLKFEHIQKKVEVHLSTSNSKADGNLSKIQLTTSADLLSNDLNDLRKLKELIQQAVDSLFNSNAKYNVSHAIIMPPSPINDKPSITTEKYKKYINSIENIRKLEKRLGSALRRIQTQIDGIPGAESALTIVSDLQNNGLDSQGNEVVHSPTPPPSTAKPVNLFVNSPRRQIFVNQIIDSLVDAVSIRLPQIGTVKYRGDMLKLMNLLISKTEPEIERLVMRFEKRFSSTWMADTSTVIKRSNFPIMYPVTCPKEVSSSVVGIVLDSICREVTVRSEIAHVDNSTIFTLLSSKMIDSFIKHQRSVSIMLTSIESEFRERHLLLLYSLAMCCPNPCPKINNSEDVYTAVIRADSLGCDGLRIVCAAYISNLIRAKQVQIERDLLNGMNPDYSTYQTKECSLCSATEFIAWCDDVFGISPQLSSPLLDLGKDESEPKVLIDRVIKRYFAGGTNPSSLMKEIQTKTKPKSEISIDKKSKRINHSSESFSKQKDNSPVKPKENQSPNLHQISNEQKVASSKETINDTHTSNGDAPLSGQVLLQSQGSTENYPENRTQSAQISSDSISAKHLLQSVTPRAETPEDNKLMSNIVDTISSNHDVEGSLLPINSRDSIHVGEINTRKEYASELKASPDISSVQLSDNIVAPAIAPTVSTQPTLGSSSSSTQLNTPIDLSWLPPLDVGDKVLGLFECVGDWFEGVIKNVSSKLPEEHDKKYYVRYDDGDEGYCNRLMLKRSADKQPRQLFPGQKVLAKRVQPDGGYLFCHAVITSSMLSDSMPHTLEYVAVFSSDNAELILSRDDIIGPHIDKQSIDQISVMNRKLSATSPNLSSAPAIFTTPHSATFPSTQFSMLDKQQSSTTLSASASSAQLSTPIDLSWLPPLDVGDKVLGLFECVGDWFEGVIKNVSSKLPEEHDKKYYVRYDDGDEGYCNRLMLKRSADKQPRQLFPGQKVLAKNGSVDEFFRLGQIIDFDSSSNPVSYIVQIQNAISPCKLLRDDIIGPHIDKTTLETIQRSLQATVSEPVENTLKSLNIGDGVECRFGAGYPWYPAKISAIHYNSSGDLYDLLYDDGDEEFSVSRIKIRRQGEEMTPKLALNEEVDAPCALLVLLGISESNGNIIPGYVSECPSQGSDVYTVVFDMDKLGLRQDIEAKLVTMDEDLVAKIEQTCDVSTENDGFLVKESIPRSKIFSLHS